MRLVETPVIELTKCCLTWMTLVSAALPLAGQNPEPEQEAARAAPPPGHSVLDAEPSPDSAWVVYSARSEDGEVELFRAPAAGGASVRLGGPLASRGRRAWAIAPDSRRVVFLAPELSSAPLDGGEGPVRLADSGETGTPHDFALSPDGARVVFRAGSAGRGTGLFSVATDGSSPAVALVPPGAGEVEPSYRIGAGGRSVVFLHRAARGASARLCSAPVAGGPVVELGAPDVAVDAFRVTPDETRVIFRTRAGANRRAELHTVALAGGVAPLRLGAPGDVRAFELSPDGAWVVYLSDAGRDGRNELYRARADGSGAPLRLAERVATSFRIDPGSRLVAFPADPEEKERFELHAAWLDGSAPPLELSAPLLAGGHVGWFAFTPDGTRLVYEARRGARDPERSDLWLVTFAPRLSRTQIVTLQSASGLRLGPDGRDVFHLDGNERLLRTSLAGGAPVELAPGPVAGELALGTGGVVFRAGREREGCSLFRVPLDGRSPALQLAGPAPGVASITGSPGATGGGLALSQATVGYRDFSYGGVVTPAPAGEKPQSKLWWNDGNWWGDLFSPGAGQYRIHRLDLATQTWVDTGTALDERSGSKADVLWDQGSGKLYVASHVFSTLAQPTASDWGRLYRFSYDGVSKTYALDAGFPVDITRGNAEALTIARDSQGRIWATWVEAGSVMVNHSLTNDAEWGAPFVLPVDPAAVAVTTDDISAVLAFGGGNVGVMWSNQRNGTVYFAVHRDADDGAVWQAAEVVLTCAGCSDDHLSLKSDSGGRVFAVLKTSHVGPDEPLQYVVVRGTDGVWTNSVWGLVRDNHTRGILVLDEQQGRVHVFATAPTGGGTIYRKSAALTDLRFSPGLGVRFIQSATDPAINDPASTKQNVDPGTDLVVLANDEGTRTYLHNVLDLDAIASAPAITSFTPATGPHGTAVTLTGTSLTETSSVAFRHTHPTHGATSHPAAFTVLSDTMLGITVPAEAVAGRNEIIVTTVAGTATSTEDFILRRPPIITTFTPAVGPVGTDVAITGMHFFGTLDVSFNGTAAPFTFYSNTVIVAKVPAGATTGRITVTTPGGTDTSATDFVVTSPLGAQGVPITLWPPDHAMTPIDVSEALGIGGEQGSSVTVEIERISQDEPPVSSGSESSTPDAIVVADDLIQLRAERERGGNGRVYHVHYRATDPEGTVEGRLLVTVPADSSGAPAVDDGELYDSTR